MWWTAEHVSATGLLFDFLDKYMVLECDEYYHRDREGYVRRTDGDIAQALGGPLQWRACESRRTRPSCDLKLHRAYGSLGEDDEYIINE
jgi:hypothetical protein